MYFNSLKKWAGLIAVLAFPGIIYYFVVQAENHFMPLATIGVEGHVIPEFTFINQYNDTITKANYEGNIYVANFFFTSCPTICPNMISKMSYLQEKLSVYPNIKFLSHTVDPINDTPDKLLEFALSMDINLENWNFVTGNKKEIYSIASSYLVSAGKEDKSEPGGFFHSERLVLIDKEGKVRSGIDIQGNPYGNYNSRDEADIKTLVKDIKVLMAEYKKKENNNEK